MGKRSYPRARLRAELRDWSRRRRRELLGLLVLWLAVAGVFVGLAAVMDRPLITTTYAAAVGGLGVAYVGLVLVGFFVSNPHALRLLRGAWGEDLTRSELTRVRRRRVSWGHVDSLEVERGDVDHVVLLRRGGVVAIDSKWRSAWSDEICAEVVSRTGRSARRARGILATQFTSASGRHRGSAERLHVTALAVVWGPAQEDLTDDLCVDGVHVVPGRRLRGWLAARDGAPLSGELAGELLRALQQWDEERGRRAREVAVRENALSPRA